MRSLLNQIYNVENIFDETYNGKNDLLKYKISQNIVNISFRQELQNSLKKSGL